MAVISGTETLDAPLDHPRDEGEDRTNLIINYLPQVSNRNIRMAQNKFTIDEIKAVI